MGERLTIRLAEVEDAGTIHAGLMAMARSMGDEDKITSTPSDIRKHGFGDYPAFEVLIAELDGTFAGLCLTFPSFSTWRGEPGIFVQDLYVDDAHRGRRIGEALLRAAARRGKAKGAGYLRLSVDISNKKAEAFYERLGIAHCRNEHIHMIKGDAFDAFAASGVDAS